MSKYFDGDKLSGYEDSPITYIFEEKDTHIAELKQQIAEKEKDNQFFKKMYLSEKQKNDNYHTEKYGLDKPVEELRKIKLTPKEKEIYYKGFDNCERQFATHIAELQQQLEEKDADIIALDVDNYSFKQQIDNLRQQLKSQPAEIVEKIKGRFLATCQIEQGNDEMIASFQTFNRCLDTILKEYQK